MDESESNITSARPFLVENKFRPKFSSHKMGLPLILYSLWILSLLSLSLYTLSFSGWWGWDRDRKNPNLIVRLIHIGTVIVCLYFISSFSGSFPDTRLVSRRLSLSRGRGDQIRMRKKWYWSRPPLPPFFFPSSNAYVFVWHILRLSKNGQLTLMTERMDSQPTGHKMSDTDFWMSSSGWWDQIFPFQSTSSFVASLFGSGKNWMKWKTDT